MPGRRTLLASIGTIGAVAIAGCGDGTGGEQPSQTEGDGGATDPATTQDANRSDPETVARRYFERLAAGEYEAANELLRPESLAYPLEESDVSIADTEVTDVEEVTYGEASERIALAPEAELEAAVRDRVGAANWTLVYVSFPDGDTVTPVVEGGDGWSVLRLR